MTVVRLQSAETVRWRLAIISAAAELSFIMLDHEGTPLLIAEACDQDQNKTARLAALALIEIHKALSPDNLERLGDSSPHTVIAIALRDHLFNLMTGRVPSIESSADLRTPDNARRAYAEALGLLLKQLLGREGPEAVLALADRGRPLPGAPNNSAVPRP